MNNMNVIEILKDKLEQKLSDANDECHRLLDDEDINLPCEYDKTDLLDAKMQIISEILGIVYELAEETEKENDWIYCSERLPNRDEYLQNDGRFIVSDGNRTYQDLFDIYDGKFKHECYKVLVGNEDKCVVAWQPMPRPCKLN